MLHPESTQIFTMFSTNQSQFPSYKKDIQALLVRRKILWYALQIKVISFATIDFFHCGPYFSDRQTMHPMCQQLWVF